ncbi:MAG: S9 family peptidase, partial [Catenulispora sp.]|nr:S9 family peptidase [Catenulispora sp.]
AFGGDGTAAVCIGVGDRSLCFIAGPGEEPREIYAAAGYRYLIDISPDGRRLAVAGAPDGPHAAVLLSLDGTVDATLGADRDTRLWALEFRPDRGDRPELLLMAETPAGFMVATWNQETGLVLRRHLTFPSTASARWYAAGRSVAEAAVLVQHESAGRSRLLMADLDGTGARELPIPSGTVHDLSYGPDGIIYCLWGRAGTSATLLTIDPERDAEPVATQTDVTETGASKAGTTEPSVTEHSATDLWTVTGYGTIHSLLATPSTPPPWPTVFLIHGGPATHDRDLADSRVDVLRDAGYAVVRTNYRGSTGYGARWQHDFDHRVGLAQIEDLAAVRDQLLAEGLADERRVAVYGYSWGGYLALLALGVQPGLWSAGVAVYPIADYVETFATTTSTLRAVDVALFGGTPDEVRERYVAASPITYADRVRGPLLLVAATADERCPPRQVQRYADLLAARGVPHRLVWREGAHSGGHAAEQASIVGLAVGFLRAEWGAATEFPGAAASGTASTMWKGGDS